MSAKAWKPKLVEVAHEPEIEIEPQVEEEPEIAPASVYVEPVWVKRWKAREAAELEKAEIIPLTLPTIEEIQNYCVRQRWADSQRTVRENFISVRELRSDRRPKDIVLVRHAAMYLSAKLTEKSYPQIGKKFGGRDHTSVLFGVGRIEERIKNEELLMNGEPFNLERIGDI